MEKLRKGVTAIRSSPQRREIFRNFCETLKCEHLLPMLDIRTRWNSTYDMIARALVIKTGLQATLMAKEELRKFVLSEEEWEQLVVLRDFMSPIKEATMMASKQMTPNIASSAMAYEYLLKHFNKFTAQSSSIDPNWLTDIALVAAKKLEKYYPQTDGKCYLIGTSTSFI